MLLCAGSSAASHFTANAARLLNRGVVAWVPVQAAHNNVKNLCFSTASDVLLSHMITFLNDKVNKRVRVAVFIQKEAEADFSDTQILLCSTTGTCEAPSSTASSVSLRTSAGRVPPF